MSIFFALFFCHILCMTYLTYMYVLCLLLHICLIYLFFSFSIIYFCSVLPFSPVPIACPLAAPLTHAESVCNPQESDGESVFPLPCDQTKNSRYQDGHMRWQAGSPNHLFFLSTADTAPQCFESRLSVWK